MKAIFLIFICVAQSAYGGNLNWSSDSDELDPILMSYDDAPGLLDDSDENPIHVYADEQDKITFYLHTQDNLEDPQVLQDNNATSVNESYFDPSRKTMVLVHGFMESSNFDSIVELRQEYLKAYNHNVIVVNYKMYKPADGDIYVFYQHVGQVVCSLIRYLIEEFDLSPGDTHIIGHSVGVHVSGEAGKCLKKDHKIRRITGLDPANWQDLGESPMDLIRPADAEIVDCIHTSMTFGVHSPICKCNFYPHGGNKQPECENANEIGQLIGLCDHLSSFRYYQRTFTKPELYPAYKCESLNGTTLNDCSTAIAAYMGTKQDAYCDSLLYNVKIVLTPS